MSYDKYYGDGSFCQIHPKPREYPTKLSDSLIQRVLCRELHPIHAHRVAFCRERLGFARLPLNNGSKLFRDIHIVGDSIS